MKRVLKDLMGFVSAVVAVGAIAILWLAITQIIAVGIAVVVGVAVGLSKHWGAGMLAAIIAYALVMKLIHYLEIFDMISSGSTSRSKMRANRVEVTGLRLSPLPHHPACGSAPGGSNQTKG